VNSLYLFNDLNEVTNLLGEFKKLDESVQDVSPVLTTSLIGGSASLLVQASDIVQTLHIVGAGEMKPVLMSHLSDAFPI
jgi:hypothetical protein